MPPDRSLEFEFPAVQPMTAALYFDDVEGFGEWSVLLSPGALKALREVKRADGAMFQIVLKKIKQLSQGHFSRDNQKSLAGSGTEVPVYEAKMTRDTRLVYQIDCIPDLRNSHAAESQRERQAIRVLGIFTHAQLRHGRFWGDLSRQLQRRDPDYIKRCTFRNKPLNTGDNVILPAMFPPSPYQVQDTPQATPLVKVGEEDMKDIHSTLVLGNFTILSQALPNSTPCRKIYAVTTTYSSWAHVFSVSAQEREIVEHPSSCYVIGRSGTGKTTTMLLKMLSIQRTWQLYPDLRPKPRQVFVTQSRVLATKVEEYFTKLMSSFEAAACSPEELRELEKDGEQDIEFVDQDDNKQWGLGIPERFSELRDEHFPLFTTYDQLCTMLHNDIGQGNNNNGFIVPKALIRGDEVTSPTSPTSPWKSRLRAISLSASSSDYMQRFRSNFVSYGEFLAYYWDHLPQTITRGLDPALAFGEFMGVIKGSEDTIGTEQRCLDRESYRTLSARSQATFSHRRDDIYDLFIAYTKLKRSRGHYDAADRTHYILEELRNVGLGGQKVDFLYVDEVQDNLLIDTLVLRTICANRRGLFWAGDTAQTISIGSSFRFGDLKAYQHRIEKQLSDELGLVPTEPRTFELVLNYRSHGGIVNCARTIVELIMHYWPYSIDVLEPERAIIDGSRPVFYAIQENANLETSFFGKGQGGTVEFGADQCILVRNDTTKDRLRQRVGDSLVMTLYESKGLEFNDVLLYNFFEDSMATSNQWRLVLNQVSNGDNFLNVQTFDETRHASICMELKFLYVAITRARNNLWIVDGSESAEPMKVYWSRKGLIEVWSPSDKIPQLAVASASEEWSKTGRTMFLNKRYEQASVAFTRAGENRETAICNAYFLREKARLISTTAHAIRVQAFVTAAKAFITCAQDVPSKQRVNEHLAYYGAAGECYLEAHDPKNAGKNYLIAEQYGAAACAYLEGEYFDKMVEVTTRHGKDIDSGLLERLTMAARMHYSECLNIKALRNLFTSEDDALKFLENYDLDEARIELLIDLGRILEAAAIQAKNGDILKAVRLLSAPATYSAGHVRPTIEYLLIGLRRGLTLGVPSTSSPVVSELLVRADQLDKSAMTEQETDELAMYEAIRHYDSATLRTLAKTLIERGDDPAALLCLDRAFSSLLKLQGLPLVEVQASLSLCFDYIRLLNKIRRDESLVEGSNCQRLFGFQVLGRNRYLVPKHTILYKKLANQSDLRGKGTAGFERGYDDIRRGIIQFISGRIDDRAENQDNACRGVHGFAPCLRYLVQKKCTTQGGNGSCTFQHIQSEQLTVDWYRAQLRLILLQFQILDSARCDKLDVKSYWLGVLYSALHPPLQRLGSFANFDVASLPEEAGGFRVAQEWAQDVCSDLGHDPQKPLDRFRQRFMIACTLAFDLDRENGRDYIPRLPMYGSKKTPLWPRSLSREGSFIKQDFVGFITAEACNLLTFGSSYLREVLRSRLCVDLTVLCDLAERLSGLFIMVRSANSRGGIMHKVTMPRSWFIALIHPDTDLKKDALAFFEFAETMIDLMRRIDTQIHRPPTSAHDPGEQFTVDGSKMTSFTGSLYIARICFCLCLMGCNTNDDGFEKKLLSGMQSLRKRDGQFAPRAYQRYVNADGWDDLVHAFTEPLKNSPLDELVLLLHTATPGSDKPHPRYARPVSYNRLDEVPELLLSIIPSASRTDVTPTDKRRPRGEVATGNHGGQNRVGIPEERIAGGKGAEGFVLDWSYEEELCQTRINAARVVQNAYRRHLERKRAGAARKIQAAYRRHLKEKSVVREGIDAAQAHYWHLLRKRSMEMKWANGSRYYLLFRVPLAYILVCLDEIKAFVESQKKGAKKRMMTEDHGGLEELMEALNQYSKLLKITIALQKKLAPSSEFHKRRSVSDLQDAVLEVKDVVESLDGIPGSTWTKSQIERRWDRGWKWIFEKQGSGTEVNQAVTPSENSVERQRDRLRAGELNWPSLPDLVQARMY